MEDQMATFDDWHARMEQDMKLHDFSLSTRKSYSRAVRQFAEWLDRSPTTWTEEDARRYMLFLRDEKRVSPSTQKMAIHGLRFFVTYTLGREWPVLKLLRVKRRKRIPVVMSRREVKLLLAGIRRPMQRMALTTIYGLGLRLGEALRLETSHIDADRMVVWIRDAKGAKDRGVMLPHPLLWRLRDYWRLARPKVPFDAS
jgi:site-specific recombinase XerD